jgi:hypothetical protein
MYCPRCGQQQVSEEMRFCSRCGLPISGLIEWLAQGVPAKQGEGKQASLPSPRRKGLRRGAKLLFLSGVLFPVFLVSSLIVDDGAPMIVPIFVFFVALIWMLYARLFVEDSSAIKSQRARTSGLGPMSAGGALPPASNIGIHGVGEQRVRTKELAQPPSVTEHTTRLLDQE